MITTEWDRCQAALAGNVDDDVNPVTLVPITSVASIRTWDYSLPTLTQSRRFTSRRTFSSNSDGNEDFLEIIQNHNDGLTFLLLDEIGVFNTPTDIVLYGGSLLDIVLNREDRIKDWDLRLIGTEYINNEQACVDRAKEFVSTIFTKLRTRNESLKEENARFKSEGNTRSVQELLDISAIQTSRRNKTVTVNIPSHGTYKELSFQLTFEPYSNVQQLLSCCTPHCCRIAIQDNTVWVDHAARYCIESVCIVVTPKLLTDCLVNSEQDAETQASTSDQKQEAVVSATLSLRRLKKLFNKGFDIILPDLDMLKVPKKNLEYGICEVLDLTFLTIIYDSITKNKIMVKELRCDNEESILVRGYNDDEEELDSTTHQKINIGESIHHNIRCLVNNVYNMFQYVAEGDEYEQSIFDAVPLISPRMIDKSYETVSEHLLDDDHGDIINTIQGYFNATAPADVVEQLFVEPLRKELASNVSVSSSLSKIQSSLPKKFTIDEELLESLIEKEKKVLVEEKLFALPGIMKELCGSSLTPIIQKVNDAPVDDVLFRAFYGPYSK